MRPTPGCVPVYARRLIPSLSAVTLLLLAGCEVPQAPEWEVGLLIPFTNDPIAIVDLLPGEISEASVGGESAFAVETEEDSIDYNLGQMCGDPCRIIHGTTAPVPGFQYTDSLDVDFPEDLVTIDVISATLGFSLRNTLNFDPLRPHPDPDTAGSVAIVAWDIGTGARLDSLLISGADETFAPGTSKEIVLDISDAELSEGIRTVAYIDSPFDGQTAFIDTTETVRVKTVLDEIFVRAVTVVVETDTLDESLELDFDQELRDEMADNLEGGAFELTLTHNFDIEGTLDVSIAGAPEDLFSGSSLTELRLLSFDFSFAPNGRVASRNISAEELQFVARLPEIYVGYRATATGTGEDRFGRPTSRFTPDEFIATEVRITTRTRVGG